MCRMLYAVHHTFTLSCPGIGWCRRWSGSWFEAEFACPKVTDPITEKEGDAGRFCWKTQKEAYYLLLRGYFISWHLSSLKAPDQVFSPHLQAALLSQITYRDKLPSPNADGSSWITSPLFSHFFHTHVFASLSSLPNCLTDCFLPSFPLFTASL